ncbi:MAG: farnesyltranstransferase [Candidatus Pelagibacterales bacterium]|nr:MAG: farnesyltranstransferase [Pelagibacterales bacterium]
MNTPVKSLSNLLKSSLKRVEREISKNIKDEEKLITLTAGHLIKAKGKKIRPLLTLLVSKMLNYKGNADVTLAVCIEFIHNATLLHDDVIDTGKIRRGKLSANQIWGNKVSVLVGDYLLSRAFKLMVKNKSLKLLEILSQTSLILARGQIQDVGNNQNVNLTEKKYLSIIDAKTAELFRISCFLPTIITNQNKKTQKIFNDFGFNFGMAFQLSDDVLDYFGDSSKMGKSVGKDFFEGKVTYPVIHCFKKSDKKSKKIIAKLFFKRKRSKKDLALILDLMKKTNTYKSSIEFVRKYAEKAKTNINKFEGNKYKVYLDDLVDHLIIRDK